MANLIQKTILHPENSKEVDLYPKTSYEQVEGLDGIIAGINNKINNIKPGGEMVLFSYPKGAANGNITEWQLSKLLENTENYINMVNDKELYYLNDLGHEEGFLTYSHVGIENSKATIKTLTITVSAKSFVIVTTVVPTDAGGGKLYSHTVLLTFDFNDKPPIYTYIQLYSPNIDSIDTLEKLAKHFSDSYEPGRVVTFDDNSEHIEVAMLGINTKVSSDLSPFTIIERLGGATQISISGYESYHIASRYIKEV